MGYPFKSYRETLLPGRMFVEQALRTNGKGTLYLKFSAHMLESIGINSPVVLKGYQPGTGVSACRLGYSGLCGIITIGHFFMDTIEGVCTRFYKFNEEGIRLN